MERATPGFVTTKKWSSHDAGRARSMRMLTLLRNGGWSMFMILGFGCALLAAAAYFALRPSHRHEGFLEWMSRALLWAILAGISSDAATVFGYVSGSIEDERRTQIVFEG